MNFPDKIKIVKENIENWMRTQEEANPDTEYNGASGHTEVSPGWHRELNGQDGLPYLIFSFSTENELSGDENFGETNIVITKAEHREVINYLAQKGYLEIIEEKSQYSLVIAVLPKKKPIIKLKTLELISRELGECYTGQGIVLLLRESGVDEKFIIYPNTKRLVFYIVFSELTISNDPKDRDLLFKLICDAVHPLNLGGNQERANELQTKFNEYLKYDGWEIDYDSFTLAYVITDTLESLVMSGQSSEEICEEFEKSRMKDLEFLKKPENIEKISSLRKAYQSLKNVVEQFCENPSGPTTELNDAYVYLQQLISGAINELNLRGEDNFYKLNNYSPLFANLFAAEKQYQEQGKILNWENVRPKMNAIYGDIEELYQEVNGSDVINEPDKQRKLNDIQLYLSELKKKTEETKRMQKIQAKPSSKDEQKVIALKIVEMPDIKIKGLDEIAKARKEDNKNKFPHKLPSGTRWENIIIKFLDNENIFIQVKQFKISASYKDLGLFGGGNNPGPGELWNFLKVLAQVNGEITIKDPEARDKYKKQKELLAKALQNYFSIDYDPFYPYKASLEKPGNSYKIKITLIPLSEKNEVGSTAKELGSDEDNDELGINEYLDEAAPQVNEE